MMQFFEHGRLELNATDVISRTLAAGWRTTLPAELFMLPVAPWHATLSAPPQAEPFVAEGLHAPDSEPPSLFAPAPVARDSAPGDPAAPGAYAGEAGDSAAPGAYAGEAGDPAAASARVLEAIAQRVRRGEIVVSWGPLASGKWGDAAVLSAVLASLLGRHTE